MGLEEAVYSAVDNFITSIQKQKNDLIFKAFERFGYTKDWLLNNPNRVKKYELQCYDKCFNIEIYLVDDTKLFKIWYENECSEIEPAINLCIKFLDEKGD